MDEQTNKGQTELAGRGGTKAALVSVQARGELHGLVLKVELRQTYRNTTSENLETVYTFPMAWGTTLLGMKVGFDGREMIGTVIPKADAEERYEQAVVDGDTPVMLEWAGKDLYTANIGNLLPGEQVVVEVEYAQILTVKHGRLRISIPCTLAPRYGEQTFATKALHHFYEVNPLAEYRFGLELCLPRTLGAHRLNTPSHRILVKEEAETLKVTVQRKAMLDRDFVINIDDLEGMAFSVASEDESTPGQYVALTSFVPLRNTSKPPSRDEANAIQLKVLVDCSGSMAGDSIAQARLALSGLLSELGPNDAVSLSKFGTQTANVLGYMKRCTPDYKRELHEEIQFLDATLGGTELEKALNRVIPICTDTGEASKSAAILLITDGEVWNIESTVATVRQSKHRIFAIGVGSAPAESLLQDLAVVSGGACTIVGPNEDMRHAVLEMVQRLRSAMQVHVDVDYGVPRLWESDCNFSVICEDTVHHWARLSSAPMESVNLRWNITDRPPHNEATAKWQVKQSVKGNSDRCLARVLASQQLLDITDCGTAQNLAMQYQLVTPHTNFFLVFDRSQDSKALSLPYLQQIGHMQPAGWGGASTVRYSPRTGANVDGRPDEFAFSQHHLPSVWRTNRKRMGTRFSTLSQAVSYIEENDNPLVTAVHDLNAQAMSSNNFRQAWAKIESDELTKLLAPLMMALDSDGVDATTAGAVFFLWLKKLDLDELELSRYALRLARGHLVRQADSTILGIEAILNEALATPPASLPLRDREDRLSHAELADDYEIPAFLRRSVD